MAQHADTISRGATADSTTGGTLDNGGALTSGLAAAQAGNGASGVDVGTGTSAPQSGALQTGGSAYAGPQTGGASSRANGASFDEFAKLFGNAGAESSTTDGAVDALSQAFMRLGITE